jgi:hypothetical protein
VEDRQQLPIPMPKKTGPSGRQHCNSVNKIRSAGVRRLSTKPLQRNHVVQAAHAVQAISNTFDTSAYQRTQGAKVEVDGILG